LKNSKEAFKQFPKNFQTAHEKLSKNSLIVLKMLPKSSNKSFKKLPKRLSEYSQKVPKKLSIDIFHVFLKSLHPTPLNPKIPNTRPPDYVIFGKMSVGLTKFQALALCIR